MIDPYISPNTSRIYFRVRLIQNSPKMENNFFLKVLHIVIFPYLAHGHINGFVNLASLLHNRNSNFTITFVSTPHHIQSVRSSSLFSSAIRFHSLPFFPELHGLPPNTESLADLKVSQFVSFLHATKSLQPAFDDFISAVAFDAASHGTKVAIVSDIFLGWTVEVARKYRVSHSVFLTTSCYGGAVFLSLWINLPHTKTTSQRFSLPEYPDVRIHRSQLRKEELEQKWIDMVAKSLQIPIFPIGPLIGGLNPASPTEATEIIEWLDLHPPASVLYISFGSQNSIQKNQMLELELGLEASRRPFIWVIRPPLGFNVKDEFKDEWLPAGFEKRMKEEKRGFFVHGWAPQIAILSHKSTGAFLSHCGWNSVLESLNSGIPIIGSPIGGEQPFNVTILVELGVCVEVARGIMENSEVEKEKVADVVEMVMGDNEKGRFMRERTKEIRDVMKKAWKDESCSSAKGLAEYLKFINCR
ncbi:Glycosyltransferase [Rhynchospora pubera]|uniref:Glycosyltransferase n=1 Tax=Rhynchospora pubera TaxID=906938 RepID=A0AAV8G8N7_9POAL|nr:Glycosyltransferase [Rhynchospora pubera]KAJ4800575.1 Glycosyltransferase [Rhynchospora pubera]